jgi:hypothetical protein
MIDGQWFNGLLQCHWDCQDVVREKMGEQNASDLVQLRINERLRQEGLYPGHRLWQTLGGSV